MLPIENLSQFISEVNAFKRDNVNQGNKSDLLFRGQKSEYILEPSLLRYKGGNSKNLEQLALMEFKRQSPPLIEIEPKDDFDWIVIAQHFGLPTRLLDWTYNPLSALWFALCEFRNIETIVKGGSASVWIFEPFLEDFRKQQNYDGSVFELNENMIYRPRNLTSRVVNQSSIFTIHSLDNPVDLEQDPTFKAKLYQYIIKPGCENDILEELHIMNINESTIYPDLGGLCGHLKWRYFER